MEDIICVHLVPLCPRLWRTLACTNKAINARLGALERAIPVAECVQQYTNGIITYTITSHGIKHGPFTLIGNNGEQVAAGNYRLGLLHSELTTSGSYKRTIYYHNGRLHGTFKVSTRGFVREANFNYGILHGPQRWETSFGSIGTRVSIAEYVDGVINGIEESYVNIGDKVYPYYSRSFIMGKAHGRSRVYNINAYDLNNIRSILAFDVEFDNGKINYIHKTCGDGRRWRWTRQYNKPYLELWNGDKLEHKGETSYGGYSDVIIISDLPELGFYKNVYESRYRNQNGFYMSYLSGRDTLYRLYTNRQFIMNGTDIIFGDTGRICVVKTVADGYLHGVYKVYTHDQYTGDIRRVEITNFLFDHNIGTRQPPTQTH